MSYTITGKPTALLIDAAKQARVPAVIQAMATRFGWHVTNLDGELVIGTDEKAGRYAKVTYNPRTCTFSGNEDFGNVLAILNKVLGPISQRRANSLSDIYETVDAAVAVQQAQGWDWEWASDTAVQINDDPIRLSTH